MVKWQHIVIFFHMIRPVNLLIIILSQVFTRYFIIGPLLQDSGSQFALSTGGFILMVSSTVLIAAAGYVINDMLDAKIDSVNRPRKVLGQAPVSRESREIIYFILNILGVAGGVWLSLMVGKIELSILFVVIATMLYYYSFKYKYLPFWGNLSIAVLTAVTIIIVWLFEFFAFRASPAVFASAFPSFQVITAVVGAYALFAFLTTLSREVAKDMQDIEGDARNGCRTLPVKFGPSTIQKAMVAFNAFLLFVLATFQAGAFIYNYPLLGICLLLPELLLIMTIYRIAMARDQRSWKLISGLLKAVMVTGLFSMIFIQFRNF
jgi:4-hydroxybenzoate polyprenyltransferase